MIDHAEQKQWRLDDTTLNIRTIDSFCHGLTRQMPILSGTGGLVEPVDNARRSMKRPSGSFSPRQEGHHW